MNDWQDLANAIIDQAVKDYRAAAQELRWCPDSKRAAAMIRDVEIFFHSAWYEQLTNVDGDFILNRLRKEVAK